MSESVVFESVPRTSTPLTFAGVSDLFLVGMNGKRFSNVITPKIRIALSLSSAPTEDDPNGARAEASVSAFPASEDATDQDEPIYEGSVAYYIRLEQLYTDLAGHDIVTLVWPYLRSGLVEHAARLGALALQLPINIEAEQLVQRVETPDVKPDVKPSVED